LAFGQLQILPKDIMSYMPVLFGDLIGSHLKSRANLIANQKAGYICQEFSLSINNVFLPKVSEGSCFF